MKKEEENERERWVIGKNIKNEYFYRLKIIVVDTLLQALNIHRNVFWARTMLLQMEGICVSRWHS